MYGIGQLPNALQGILVVLGCIAVGVVGGLAWYWLERPRRNERHRAESRLPEWFGDSIEGGGSK